MRYLPRVVSDGAKVLEIACGLGYFLQKLKTKYIVFAIDISGNALRYIKKIGGFDSLVQADAMKLPLVEASFDCIIAFDLLEHLNNPETFVKQTKKILKKGGVLIGFSKSEP
jgi:ubiquinone/menaquinone biosynthesis C-methylase UbiE